MIDMNKQKYTDNQIDIIQVRLEKINARLAKQIYLALVFWLSAVAGLAVLIHLLMPIHTPPLLNFAYAFFLATMIVAWFQYIPFLGVLIVIILRTKSRNYINQLIPNLGVMFAITTIGILTMIEGREDIFTLLYIGVIVITLILEVATLYIFVRGRRSNKKPLFLTSFLQNPFEAYKASILTQHSLLIKEELDGYSPRPFFISFPEINENCHNQKDFSSKIQEYASILTERSELIGWDLSETKATLYLRVLIANPDIGFGITYFWKILFKILFKKNLTALLIDYEKKEIALRIAQEDYDLLHDVTYHLLGQSILKQFIESLEAFFNNEKEKVYTILSPLSSEN